MKKSSWQIRELPDSLYSEERINDRIDWAVNCNLIHKKHANDFRYEFDKDFNPVERRNYLYPVFGYPTNEEENEPTVWRPEDHWPVGKNGRIRKDSQGNFKSCAIPEGVVWLGIQDG